MKQIYKRKHSTKNNLGPIRTIFPLSLDAQRTRITMDFLKKTKEMLKQSGKQLKVVSATFVLVCFLSLNESTSQTKKKKFISLRKFFLFSRKSNFRLVHFQIS